MLETSAVYGSASASSASGRPSPASAQRQVAHPRQPRARAGAEQRRHGDGVAARPARRRSSRTASTTSARPGQRRGGEQRLVAVGELHAVGGQRPPVGHQRSRASSRSAATAIRPPGAGADGAAARRTHRAATTGARAPCRAPTSRAARTASSIGARSVAAVVATYCARVSAARPSRRRSSRAPVGGRRCAPAGRRARGRRRRP